MSAAVLLGGDVGWLLRLALSVAPVFLFLLALVFLDSYKLVRLRSLALAILFGALAAGLSYGINTLAFGAWHDHESTWSRLGAPVVEELLKASCVFWLVGTGRVGFMVDAAIFGFATGSGFAAVENLYYLQALSTSNAMVWLLRGMGTAAMHGGTTALVGILAAHVGSSDSDREQTRERAAGRSRRVTTGWLKTVVPALMAAYAIHALYNSAPLGPLWSGVAVLAGLPVLLVLVFLWSERELQNWLCEGFDADVEMLGVIAEGGFRDTNAGVYLARLRDRFKPEVVADMFCLLQLSLELSVRAKAELMTREAGFKSEPDPEVDRKFEELDFLNRSIGPTGRRALSPLLAGGARDLWQLRLLR